MTRYLLDTNIVSETRHRRPDANVVAFLGRQSAPNVFISALTIGELRKGVKGKRKRDPAAADDLGIWVDGIEQTFGDRVLPVDARVAALWGEASADRSRSVVDTLIAATAMAHGLTLVTRNTKDFADLAVEIFDPFLGKEPPPASSERG